MAIPRTSPPLSLNLPVPVVHSPASRRTQSQGATFLALPWLFPRVTNCSVQYGREGIDL